MNVPAKNQVHGNLYSCGPHIPLPSLEFCGIVPRGGTPIGVRILVADDHETVRMGVRATLSQVPQFEIVAEAANGQEAVAKARETNPDAVILDISMPKMNGLEAAKEIRRLSPSAKIVIFSMHDSAQMIGTAREAGADAFVLKTAPSQELIRTIRNLVFGSNGNGEH